MRAIKVSAVVTLLAVVSAVFADIISDLQGHGFEVAVPGSARYVDASSPYNWRFDAVDPAAITFPQSTQDISEILQVCSQNGVAAVARSGGHSYIANGIGGNSGAVVIDLASFKEISVDDYSKVATIGTGNRLGDIASHLNDKGRALPHGTCKMVGIGGHSSYGGYGFTSRKWGLTLDRVQGMEVVLANGTIASLSADRYPDLFWAFRGAGGSFGIVTKIFASTVEAPPSATFFSYTYDMTPEEAADALDAFQAHAHREDLPQEYGAEVNLNKGSALGRVSVTILGGWYGAQDQFQPVIQPLLDKIPQQPTTKVVPGTYLESVIALDGSGSLDTSNVSADHDNFFVRSLTVPESVGLTESARKAFTTFLSESANTPTSWFCQVELYGGTNSAINNVPFESTSFGHRDAIFILQLYTFTSGRQMPFPQSGFDFVNGVVDSIVNNSPPDTKFGAYANYIEADLPNWQEKYYGAHYPKLQQLKKQYDPTNTLRFPTAIELLCASPSIGQSLRDLKDGLGYDVSIVLPGEPRYKNASQPFNLRFDYKPAAVAFPMDANEVSQVIRLGALSNHTVVARSGGHSYIANGLGGQNNVIVVDLSNLKGIGVDDHTGVAIIQTGNLLGDIVTALNRHGRALPHGTCPYVGIGGHAGYGGYGFTSRMWGLTIDRIASIEVVLANGEIRLVSEQSDEDLFWAMRGAAGSYGIATAITFLTFPAPSEATIFSYSWHLSASDSASVLFEFQKFTLTGGIPSYLAGELVLTKADLRGNVNIGFTGGWYAPIQQLNSTLAPFLAQVPPPVSTNFDTGDYIHSATNLAGGSLETTSFEGTDTFYAKSLMTPSSQPMSEQSIKALMDVVSTVGYDTPGWWFFQVEQVGGTNSAINAVKASDTAFIHRDSLFVIQFYSSSPGNIPPYPQSGFNLLEESVNAIIHNNPQDWKFGAYANYLDDKLSDWWYRYYGSNYQRLQSIKQTYDPEGLFSFPTGIQVDHDAYAA